MAEIRLFGHPAIEHAAGSTAIGAPQKAVVLLALLVANRTRPLAREWLAQRLWPDADSAESRANLRRHLHLLSKAVGENALLLTHHTAQWSEAAGIGIDVVRFEALAASNSALALSEYAGDLCTGIDDELLDDLRSRYRLAFETLLRSLIAKAQKAADDTSLALFLQRAVAHDPFDETAVRELMSLRRRSGDAAGAIREYKALAHRLRAELGVEPQHETTELLREMLLREEQAKTPNNLPAYTTTFVGRQRELLMLSEWLREHRLVTLVGPAGIGKTRLAMRASFDLLSAFPGGVWFVDLQTADSESAAWARLARAAGAAGDEPATVLAQLNDGPALLVLDTCEHISKAAARIVERVLSETRATVLATSRRRLGVENERTIMLEPLDVPPRTLPPGSPLRYDAYRLFLERAALSNPSFRAGEREAQTIADIVRTVDGLPLAIELIASRANVLTLEGMRKRLDAAMHARGGGLESALSWSYDLLSAEQRTMFERLSVLQSAFSVEDAEALCAGTPNAADLLFDLIDASLIAIRNHGGEIVYAYLETTRRFALALLHEHHEERTALERHVELFARKARALARMPEPEFRASVEAVLAAIRDYTAALQVCIERQWCAVGTEILEGVRRCVQSRYLSQELFGFTERLLAMCEEPGVEARLHMLGSFFSERMAEYGAGLQHAAAAAEYHRRAGDTGALRAALTSMAVDHFRLGQFDRCEQLLHEVRESAARDRDTEAEMKARGRLATLLSASGDFHAARMHLREVADALRSAGHTGLQLNISLRNLALAEYSCREYELAIRTIDEALAMPGAHSDVVNRAMLFSLQANAYRSLGDVRSAVRAHAVCAGDLPDVDPQTIVDCMEDIAGTLAACGRLADGARALGFGDALRTRIRAPRDAQAGLTYEDTAQFLRRALGDDYERLRAEGASSSEHEALAEASRCLHGAAEESEDTPSLS